MSSSIYHIYEPGDRVTWVAVRKCGTVRKAWMSMMGSKPEEPDQCLYVLFDGEEKSTFCHNYCLILEELSSICQCSGHIIQYALPFHPYPG